MGDQELEVSLAERWSEDTELVGADASAAPGPDDGGRAVSYVDAGYAVALGALFVYAVSLVLRRRRWERALRASRAPVAEPTARRPHGERS